MSEFTVAFITFVLTVVGTYLTTRRNLELQYDAELRRDRLDTYRKLWNTLNGLSRYGRPANARFSRQDAEDLATELKQWYFETGGIFLSVETRGRCFELQRALHEVLAPGGGWRHPDEAYEYLRVLGSRLRTSMTRDVGTRKTFKLRGEPEPMDPAAAAGEYDRGNAQLILSFRTHVSLRRWVSTVRVRLPVKPRLDLRDSDDAWIQLVVDCWNREDGEIIARDRRAPGGHARRFLLEDGAVVEGPLMREESKATIWRKRARDTRSDLP